MGSWLPTPSDSSSGAPGAELPEKQTQMERSGLRAEFSVPQCLEGPARETKRNGQRVRRRSKILASQNPREEFPQGATSCAKAE